MMAFKQDISLPSIRSEVNIFELPETDTTVEYSAYTEHKPVINVTDSSSKIEIQIQSSPGLYIDLFDSFIYVKVKAVKNDKSAFAATDDFSVVNNFVHSMFSQVELYANSKLISSVTCYPYKAMMENLLTYSQNYIENQGSLGLFCNDTDNGSLSVLNLGYKKRKEYFTASKTVELIDKLRFDLANQPRYILSDTVLNLFLTRNSDEFMFLSPTPSTGTNPSPKLQILDMSFFVRKHSIYPSIALAHHKILNSGKNAVYPMLSSQIKFYTIPKGNQSFLQENLFSSVIPHRIVIGLVKNSSFIGTYEENPFVFSHNNLSNIRISVNNMPVPIRPISYDFKKNEYLLGYYMLYSAMGKNTQDFSLPFSREQFPDANALFAFDINPLIHENNSLYLEKCGSVCLEMKFSTALAQAVTCLVYYEYQSILEIDRFKQVSLQ